VPVDDRVWDDTTRIDLQRGLAGTVGAISSGRTACCRCVGDRMAPRENGKVFSGVRTEECGGVVVAIAGARGTSNSPGGSVRSDGGGGVCRWWM